MAPRRVRGDSTAMMNVAAAYRVLGNPRLTFRWFKKAADVGDGDPLDDIRVVCACRRGPMRRHATIKCPVDAHRAGQRGIAADGRRKLRDGMSRRGGARG